MRASPERSFDALYRHYAPHLYRYTLALLGSPADAEEVTQTAFLNAYRAIERGERPRNPSAWLHAIALNLCRQRFRQAARRPSEVPLEDDVADLVVDDHDPTLEDVTRALKHLPFNQRAALVMREFGGLTAPEIAQSLAVSTSAVEALLFRARRSLREQLEGSLTCDEAEHALSRQLDGLLGRAERGALRAHLRECDECARLARSMRGQRGALKSLAVVPLPAALASAPQIGAGASLAGASLAGASLAGAGPPLFGAIAAKLAVGAAAAALLAGVGYQAITQHSRRTVNHRLAAPGPGQRATTAAQRPAPAARGLFTRSLPRRTAGPQALANARAHRGGRVVLRPLVGPSALIAPAIVPNQSATKGFKQGTARTPTTRPSKTYKAPTKGPKPANRRATNVKHTGSSKPAKPTRAATTKSAPSKTKAIEITPAL